MNQNKYTFHVHGMHCNSCVLLTESKIGALNGITRAKTNLAKHSIEIEGDFGNLSDLEIAQKLTEAVKEYGYTVSIEKIKNTANWSEFKIAIPLTILVILGFVLLQKIGIVNLIDGGEINYGTAFIIGIIASLSSCMAVVGGLLLSMSATFAKEGENYRPQILFHIGRLASFFVLGGVIGLLGKAFTLSVFASFTLSLLIGLVMLILGINLLDVFPWAKKIGISMPKFIGKRAHGISGATHSLAPLLVGIATFFLPCGFTQSMQIYTLTSGSFISGAINMTAFALGTLPVLAIISFSSLSITKNKNAGIFFKTAGLVVIAFALYNILSALSASGIIKPLFNF